ncbi:putative bifunctional diguanylate cyclase/phosphodiesterase [Arenibaculum sp.]|uniref:putative bifunctional diguanylate cyclase/phosphodiesterase n=1 Tax=Arenibaculum sp. TaxID=2865862 RepID=UPI002E13AB0F|nr:EAL domain-containing protein [Arenibaculum sp.]
MEQLIERYELAIRAGREAIWDWDLRTDQIYYSARFLQLLGLPGGDLTASPDLWLGRVHPDDVDWLNAVFQGQLGEQAPPFHLEHRVERTDGSWCWLLCRGVAIPGHDGEPVRLVGSVADVTERKLAEEALRRSEERYALAARGANDGLWDWNLETDEIYYSPRWKQMLGCADAVAASPRTWFERVVAADRAELEAAIGAHLTGDTGHLEHEFRMRHSDGSELWLLVRGIAVRLDDGRPVRMAGSLTDVTARKRAERQLLFDALHDGLTGLPNRTLLIERIGQALDRDRRARGGQFAVLLLDIDRFKTINDSLGPVDGDQVLMTTAARLDKACHHGDTVARLSADEFGLLVNEVDDIASAVTAARRFADAVAQPIRLGDDDHLLTCSVGVALSGSGYAAPDDMLRDASLAMFRAKTGGGNRVELFDGQLHRHALDMLRLETDLRTAIDAGELCLFYQPIVSMATGRLAGFEALMRWRHPRRGLMQPSEFIPVAEETGLIVPMGRWALHKAAKRLAAWQRLRDPVSQHLFMSVNVSGKQFAEDDLVGLVAEVLDAHPSLDPASIKLEITESLLMQDPERSVQLMRRLKALGVRLSLDDFGTGYSSLSYLSRFPVDTLKIDRSFVSGIAEGGGGAEIVRIIGVLANALLMEVTAEGIESQPEVEFLRGLPTHYGQGFLFGRPMPEQQADRMVRRDPLLLEAVTS